MGAAAHLGIDLRTYDRRIRTFIPGYDEMLRLAVHALDACVKKRAPVVVDLGVGTGALSARSRMARPHARFVGVDEDQEMLAAARARLRPTARFIHGSFERVGLPRCDAVVASLALHHVPTLARRLHLFRRLARALRPGGALIIADCYLSSTPRMRAADTREWLAHLERSYSPLESRAYLHAWAKEDFYVPLAEELRLLQRARLQPDVVGRRGCFAVIAAARPESA